MAMAREVWPVAVSQYANRKKWQQRLPVQPSVDATQVTVDRERDVDEENNTTGLPEGIQHVPQSVFYRCIICQVKINGKANIPGHVDGKRHGKNAAQHQRGDFKKDGYTVRITCDCQKDTETTDKEVHVKSEIRKEVKAIFTIKNYTKERDVCLESCELLPSNPAFYRVCNPPDQPITIKSDKEYKVVLAVRHSKEGLYYTSLTFGVRFGNTLGYEKWVVHMKCSLPIFGEKLKQSTPYIQPPVSVHYDLSAEKVVGIRGESNVENNLKIVRKLPEYAAPKYLQSLLNHGFEDWNDSTAEQEELLDTTLETLGANLRYNYSSKLSLILHIEESQELIELQQYAMKDVHMERCDRDKDLLKLKVPGLLEGRPSVKRNDEIYVTVHRKLAINETPKEYQGFVHDVERDCVILGFDRRFVNAHYPNRLYDVRFSLNRIPYRLQHQAVFLAEDRHDNLIDTVLFPSPDPTNWQRRHENIDLRYINDQLNAEQKQAVRQIVAASSQPAPYLVFGPPGTGKTMTIIEAVQQIVLTVKKSKILLCAPSNTAADLLAVRLGNQNRHLEEERRVKFIRLRSPVTDPDSIPTSIKPDTNYRHPNYFFPSVSGLESFHVIISTLVTAGRLVKAALPKGFFTDIIIDEAAFATETETLIPISGILTTKKGYRQQVVLAGDPKQLGPILQSPIAEHADFDISMMERLMRTQIYLWDDASASYNVQYITKLVRNYRSHGHILHMPNVFFYRNQLVACADPSVKDALLHCPSLPCEGFPLIFHGVVGDNVRESNSPSWFNPQEAVEVVTYVDLLLKDKSLDLHEKDIGIVTPYRKQVDKIKQALIDRYPDYENVKVGSVENFQGNERKVIIVSTVRTHGSASEEEPVNPERHIGFLKNPKRFNVTVTRAKALLIVIGNPFILRGDHHWKGLLNYCKKNGGCRGCDYVEEPGVIANFVQWATGEICDYFSSVLDRYFGLRV